jgi:hypothetical protein
MGMPSIECSDRTEATSTQPATVVTLLREFGVRIASGVEVADVLRIWVRDNVPNRALRVTIRRNGYGFVLDQRFGRSPRRAVPNGRGTG